MLLCDDGFPERANRVSAVSRSKSGLGGAEIFSEAPESGLDASLSTPLSTIIAPEFSGFFWIFSGFKFSISDFSGVSSFSTEKKFNFI